MSVKIRVNITLDAETLRLADRLARRQKTSRSALLREGVRALAENHSKDEEEATRHARQREAMQGIRQIARRLGNWPAAQIVHAWRYRLKGNQP